MSSVTSFAYFTHLSNLNISGNNADIPLANIKMEQQIRPEKALILGKSGTQYVAMVTKLSSSYCGAC